MFLLQSRAALSKNLVPEGTNSIVAAQDPSKDTILGQPLSLLRTNRLDDAHAIVREDQSLFREEFRSVRGLWGVRHREVQKLLMDNGPEGERFRETLWNSAEAQARARIEGFIGKSGQAFPTPAQLFHTAFVKGLIRFPPKERLDIVKLRAEGDPNKIITIAEKLWAYSGFDGIARNYAYGDVEGPPRRSKGSYNGQGSRRGVTVHARFAWNPDEKVALIGATPMTPSNMLTVTDRKACHAAVAARMIPFMFSAKPEERLRCAEELGGKVFICIRSNPKEVKLGKRLLDLGANVHIEMANDLCPAGIGAVLELGRHLEASRYPVPRFLGLGKSVGGVGYLAAAIAGAHLHIQGRASGSICSTSIVTGEGLRTFSGVYEAACAQQYFKVLSEGIEIVIIADGALSVSGDFVKAGLAGAEAGMSGSLFVATMDSACEKVEVLEGPAENPKVSRYGVYAGDASPLANPGKKGIAPQGVMGHVSIPREDDGEWADFASVAGRMTQGIQAGVADGAAESWTEFLSIPRPGYIRVKGPAAAHEANTRVKPLDFASAKVVQPQRQEPAPPDGWDYSVVTEE